MMYDEFLDIAGLPEFAIAYADYKSIIEPAYNISILNKRDFVKSLDLESLFTEEYNAVLGLIKAAKIGGRVFINAQSTHDYCLMKGYEPDIINGIPVLWAECGGFFPVFAKDVKRLYGCRVSLEGMIYRNVKL